jgi:hypothetical protein
MPMGDKKDTPFSKDETQQLECLLNTLKTFCKENESLAEKLNLKRKLVGTIGEGWGLLLCYQKFKDSVSYEWAGGRKKGYDLILKGKKAVKVQVKTTTEEKYLFNFPSIKVNKKAIEQVKKGNREPLFEQLKSDYKEIDADFFLLIHLPKINEELTCYILDKSNLIKAIKQDYECYVTEGKHRKNFNYAISKKTGEWLPRLNYKTVDSIEKFKEDWKPITETLGLSS